MNKDSDNSFYWKFSSKKSRIPNNKFAWKIPLPLSLCTEVLQEALIDVSQELKSEAKNDLMN